MSLQEEEDGAEPALAPGPDDRDAEVRRLALRLAECTSVLEAWVLKSQIQRLLREET